MYKELSGFVKSVVRQPAVWKDGDFITAVVVAGLSFFGLKVYPSYMDGVKKHLADILTATSIVFGFALSTLTFYIPASANWKQDKNIQSAAQKLIDWHVWTVLWLLALMAYVVLLWIVDPLLSRESVVRRFFFTGLVFVAVYVGGQIINHALTLHWFYGKRSAFEKKGS